MVVADSPITAGRILEACISSARCHERQAQPLRIRLKDGTEFTAVPSSLRQQQPELGLCAVFAGNDSDYLLVPVELITSIEAA